MRMGSYKKLLRNNFNFLKEKIILKKLDFDSTNKFFRVITKDKIFFLKNP